MTTEITPQGLEKAFQALGRVPSGKVAVKVHFGEPGGNFYLDPQLIGGLVQSLGGTLVETNTVSGGSPRANTALHLQIAADHGFADIAPVEILDAGGAMALPVEGGKHLTENLVGAGLAAYAHGEYFALGERLGTFGFSVRKKPPRKQAGRRAR